MSSALTSIRKGIGESITVTAKPPAVDKRRDSKSIWDIHDTMLEQSTDHSNCQIDKNLELDQYLKLPLVPRTENIFNYWKNVTTSFPVLSNFALRRVATLATVSHQNAFYLKLAIRNETGEIVLRVNVLICCYFWVLVQRKSGLSFISF